MLHSSLERTGHAISRPNGLFAFTVEHSAGPDPERWWTGWLAPVLYPGEAGILAEVE